jgi:hypothetical protein
MFLPALRAFAASSVFYGMSVTLETAGHDSPFARYSSTFRQFISRKGRPMCFLSLRAHVKTLQIAQSFMFDEKL